MSVFVPPPAPVANSLLFRFIDAATHQLFNLYECFAAHRTPYTPPLEQRANEETVLLLRGTSLFSYGSEFLDTVEQAGYRPAPVLFGQEGDRRHFMGMPEMVARTMDQLIRYNEKLDWLVGHSSGGILAGILAALRDTTGETREHLVHGLVTFMRLDEHREPVAGELKKLALRLKNENKGCISIGSPYRGIPFRQGWIVRKALDFIERRRPGLYSYFEPEKMAGLQQMLGINPEDYIDGNVVGVVRPWHWALSGGPLSRAISGTLEGAIRFGALFTRRQQKDYDALVARESAELELPEGREEIIAASHITEVDRKESAGAVVRIMLRIRSWRERTRPLVV